MEEEETAWRIFSVGFALDTATQGRIALRAKARAKAAARKEEEKVKVKVASRAKVKEKANPSTAWRRRRRLKKFTARQKIVLGKTMRSLLDSSGTMMLKTGCLHRDMAIKILVLWI